MAENKGMERVRSKIGLATALIVLGLILIHTLSMFPAPLLITIGAHFAITNDALLNLVVNIVFIFTVIGCVVGMRLDSRIGTRRLYSLALICVVSSSLVLVFGARAYAIVLIGRSLLGLGVGISIPFIGSAIMRWYQPLQREKMDAFNGFLPFIGPLICYLVAVPLSQAMGGHWELSMAIWGIPIAVTLILWSTRIKEGDLADVVPVDVASRGTARAGARADVRGLVKGLLRRREMRLLILATICDYSCYAYVGTILPMLLTKVTAMGGAQANLLAALVFPAVGVVGILVAGVFLTRTGLRKPLLLMGQYGEVCGLALAAIGANRSFGLFIAGIVVFALANALWTPALFVVPHDLPGMDPTRAGAAFALINILGETFSFLAPLVGGLLTGFFLTRIGLPDPVASHVLALSLTLAVFACFNIMGAVAVTLVPETGEKRFGRACG